MGLKGKREMGPRLPDLREKELGPGVLRKEGPYGQDILQSPCPGA